MDSEELWSANTDGASEKLKNGILKLFLEVIT